MFGILSYSVKEYLYYYGFVKSSLVDEKINKKENHANTIKNKNKKI